MRWVALLALVFCGCSSHPKEARERPIGAALKITSPLGLPPLRIPADNPPTAETVALGRKLFYDPRLSANDKLSCATCHNPLLGFADGRRFSSGTEGKPGTRNAPTILNSAYSGAHFWDGRAATLEDQAPGPIANPVEMNQSHDLCSAKLNNDPEYVAEFAKAFGPGPITMSKISSAIASFERTALSGNSPFDRYQFGGDRSAMSPAAVRGLALFRDKSKGNCETCHNMAMNYAVFTDGKYHNLGVGVGSDGQLIDLGRYEQTKREYDKGAFKTPTLRNIALTAPYMHDGSLKTLRAVVDFYAGGGNSNPWIDREMKPLNLTSAEREDLVAFLESLTGDVPAGAGPPAKK